jgi:hypothetical protein
MKYPVITDRKNLIFALVDPADKPMRLPSCVLITPVVGFYCHSSFVSTGLCGPG